jgi:hypothetical protein
VTWSPNSFFLFDQILTTQTTFASRPVSSVQGWPGSKTILRSWALLKHHSHHREHASAPYPVLAGSMIQILTKISRFSRNLRNRTVQFLRFIKNRLITIQKSQILGNSKKPETKKLTDKLGKPSDKPKKSGDLSFFIQYLNFE